MIKYYRSKINNETTFFMQTNGVKMDSIFESLTPNDISIGFSIDGCEELHDKYRGKGNFQKTLNNIHTAVKLGFTVTTLGVFTAESIFYSSKILLFANQMKAMGVPFSLKAVHTDDENLSLSNDMGYEFGREVGKNGLYKHTQFTIVNICSARGNECEYYQFSVDGKVYSCNKTFKKDGEFANWKDEGFFEITQKRKEVFCKPLHEDCDQCKHYWMCNGGCPADRVNGKSLECNLKRGFFDWAEQQGILPHTLFRTFTRKIQN
jgi:radical SAM protein with 4Fe4S-binding SPASM domain